MAGKDPLPVPAQLEAQLGKCRSVRNDECCKSRDKTKQVRIAGLSASVRALVDRL